MVACWEKECLPSQGKTNDRYEGNAPEDAQQKFMWAVQKAQTVLQ
ncbi:MAG: hypothetical protein U0T85_08730 [Cloacibacterium normanense]